MIAPLTGARVADRSLEWLETDGLGGFAMGTPAGVRTRRYHGLLIAATTPPTGRVLLVADVEAWIESPQGRFALSTHHYASDDPAGVLHPDGHRRLSSFALEPWPTWTSCLPDGTTVQATFCLRHGAPLALLAWSASGPLPGARLLVRPLLAGRDVHADHHENGALRFDSERTGDRVRWQPYPALPAVVARSNGAFTPAPEWFRRSLLEGERARGFAHHEDLASPGVFSFDLSGGDEAVLLLAAELQGASHGAAGLALGAVLHPAPAVPVVPLADRLRADERTRRAAFPSPLHRAADAYLVRRGAGASLVAGYPWFADWGRDTFIALRGLCLATGRLDQAASILLEWAGEVSQGMLPNLFTEGGGSPEYNAADASLWYVVCVGELLDAAAARPLAPPQVDVLRRAVLEILRGYGAGTRYGIRADVDGLLAAGAPGWQLTWMDARVDGREITPRSGKPVELQALWAAALSVGARWEPGHARQLERVRAAFEPRFWNPERRCLLDVVDVGHVAGVVDASLRPNQILAVGGLPVALLTGDRARAVVDAVEHELWTPLGPRSLAPDEPGYCPRYEGGPAARDGAYHQGTVWPWLAGPFVEAWVAVRGGTAAARREARMRFLAPLHAHLAQAGLGHVSEIADASAPHDPRGAPFQAWSLGELLRLEHGVLAQPTRRRAARTPSAARA